MYTDIIISGGETTKRRITLTIDDDIYQALDNLPRKISVSQLANYFLRLFIEISTKGRELSKEELKDIINSLGGEDFLRHLKDALGPAVRKFIENGESLNGLWNGEHDQTDIPGSRQDKRNEDKPRL